MKVRLKASDRNVKKIWYDGKECIWVDGYKGTKNNLTCNEYQYILNQEHLYEGKVEVCSSGFHFCPKLKDVFGYYGLDDGNRFFRVKALVYKEDYENNWRDKLAAKKIILTEELTFNDLKEYIHENLELVETEEDWKQTQAIGYEEFRRNLFINDMKKYGYGDTFINILYDDAEYNDLPDLLNKAKAFHEEELGKEMSIYLLLK